MYIFWIEIANKCFSKCRELFLQKPDLGFFLEDKAGNRPGAQTSWHDPHFCSLNDLLKQRLIKY